MFAKTISAQELNILPVKHFEGETFVVDDLKKLKEVLPLISSEKLLGFDTETRPNFKKGRTNHVALLQLATRDKAFLFRINKIGLPSAVTKILSDKNIIKVGAAIRDDIRTLKLASPFAPQNFVELQDFVEYFDIESKGLSKLAAIVLNFRISKSQQLSNWENETLTAAQINYAATDAWVGYEIFQKLKELSEQ